MCTHHGCSGTNMVGELWQKENKGNPFHNVKRSVVSIYPGIALGWGQGPSTTGCLISGPVLEINEISVSRFGNKSCATLQTPLVSDRSGQMVYVAQPWSHVISRNVFLVFLKKERLISLVIGKAILGQRAVSITPKLIWGVLGYRAQGLFIKVVFFFLASVCTVERPFCLPRT